MSYLSCQDFLDDAPDRPIAVTAIFLLFSAGCAHVVAERVPLLVAARAGAMPVVQPLPDRVLK
jgi:hypothetical protein